MSPESFPPNPRRRPRFRFAAFTLLELLVSLTVLSLLLLLVFSMVDRTQAGWAAAEARVSQFREARNAFELVTRRVSQAVLNAYWDYDRPGTSTTGTPIGYGRHSELHFVCGPTSSLLGGASEISTHGVFFQAPLGYVAEDELRKNNLDALLNTCGYYVEYGGDRGFKPTFVLDIAPNRERFRLMEFRPPAESMAVYEYLRDFYKKAAGDSILRGWFAEPVVSEAGSDRKEFSRPIAENIIALVMRPKKSELEAGIPTDIAPNYIYDTRLWQSKPNDASAKRSRNILPPLIEITMVAVAERSMVRYQQINGDTRPGWTDGLFEGTATDSSYESDLQSLEAKLKVDRVEYRVFNETVGIRASKWGQE